MAKKQKSRALASARKKATTARSTALVRRTKAEPSAAELVPAQALGDPIMPIQFVGKLNLKPNQVEALRRPVAADEIEWKPAVKNGPPIIPYLSHNGYRDRLDAAFGLGGWGMVPVGAPKNVDGTIYVPFALVIDGLPRAYAWGEQLLASGAMSYGDALEGCKSNAILRVGKELGIAREMWSRKYIAALTPPGGRSDYRQGAPEHVAEERQAPRHSDARSGDVISQKQRQRLYAITMNAGRSENEVKTWLGRYFGYNSSADIKRSEYDWICKAVEANANLPERQR